MSDDKAIPLRAMVISNLRASDISSISMDVARHKVNAGWREHAITWATCEQCGPAPDGVPRLWGRAEMEAEIDRLSEEVERLAEENAELRARNAPALAPHLSHEDTP